MNEQMAIQKRAKRPAPTEIESPATQIAKCQAAGAARASLDVKRQRIGTAASEPLALRAAQNNTEKAAVIIKQAEADETQRKATEAAVAAEKARVEAELESQLELTLPDLDDGESFHLEHRRVVSLLKTSSGAVFAASVKGIERMDLCTDDMRKIAEDVDADNLMRPIAIGTYNRVSEPQVGYRLPGCLFEQQRYPLVIRITRSDPMEAEPTKPAKASKASKREVHWRACKQTAVIGEVAWALIAARAGFGPRIYAAAVYPFAKDSNLVCCILVMKQYKGNLNQSLYRLAERWPRLVDRRLPQAARTHVHALAESLSHNWAHLARRCVIDFDTKLGNVVANDLVTKIIDFDVVHFYRTHTTPRVCWLVNALLMLTHTRSWAPSVLADELISMFLPPIAQILRGVERDAAIISNESWILDVKSPEPAMEFEHTRIKKATGDDKLALHLQSIVSIYFTSAESTACKWAGWARGWKAEAPLVDTLIAYLGN